MCFKCLGVFLGSIGYVLVCLSVSGCVKVCVSAF